MIVVAIVPAKDRADTIGATAAALRDLQAVDRVLVVDDGSTDATAERARVAGAEVLRLPSNVGKGAAVAAGVEASPEADVYLLIDADLSATAAAADRLLAPVLDDEADLVVGVLPPAGSQGGFGRVKGLAADGIRRAVGLEVDAPLSGQRAIRAELLRGLSSAERFGLEVAMTVDAVRAGARYLEVQVPMDHRHTGRGIAGFTHRARQGIDILRALWPRLTTSRTRIALSVLSGVLVIGLLALAGSISLPNSTAAEPGAQRVLVVGIPHLGLDDLADGHLPSLARLADEGAVAATTVRTLSTRPSTVEAYATLGAGTRVRGRPEAELAVPADAPLEGGTAAETLARRTGTVPEGTIVVPSTPAAIRDAGDDVSSEPGALGDALAAAGLTTAVVNNADEVAGDGDRVVRRPAGIALVDSNGGVDAGAVQSDQLLVPDPTEPFGVRADVERYLVETNVALERATVTLVDLGDTQRAAVYAATSSPVAAERAMLRALTRADAFVGRIAEVLPEGTLLLVVGITPPTREWALTPMVAYGATVAGHGLHSASTKRAGLVTLTDLAPTILDVLGVEESDGMIGQPLRYRSSAPDLDEMERTNDLAGSREGVYYPMAVTFIVVQALLYVLAIVLLSQHATARAGTVVRFVALTFAAWPLATFVERAVPRVEDLGDARQGLVWIVAAAIALLAMRAHRHALAPLAWIAGATVVLLLVDVATGAHLQLSSILGYSPHTAARFTGFGNTAFAVLAACAVVWAAIHVEYAPRRREAVVGAAVVLTVVLFADVWPTLGSDVGGLLTLVPVFGLMVVALAGGRVSWRTALVFGLATVAAFAVLAGIDLLRPAQDRTHLGRFVAGDGSGDGGFLETVERKWSTNVRIFGKTIWTWMVPITVAFVMYVLVIAKGWQRLLPARSALRVGIVATLTAGLIGWLVNDSGVVVSALVFVFIGPFLTLLALHAERGEPVLLEPDPA